MKPGISVQMYTLRTISKDDFLGTFDKVAGIGYAGVELAGTGGIEAAVLKKHLDSLGLKITGAHVRLDELEKNLPAVIDYHKAAGTPYVICPMLPPERRKNKADWIAIGKILGEIGRKVSDAGMGFCYHNHAFEFEPVEGSIGLDILFDAAGKNVQSELDTFWVRFIGRDPMEYIRKFTGRLPLIHVKDMQSGSDKKFAPVGQGIIDWRPILDAAQQAGTKWYVVEQDDCYGAPPLDEIRTSFENLKRLGVV